MNLLQWYKINKEYTSFDYEPILLFTKIHLDNMIKQYRKNDIYVGQEKDLKQMLIFRESLRRELEAHYVLVDEDDNRHVKQDENWERIHEGFKNMRRFWL